MVQKEPEEDPKAKKPAKGKPPPKGKGGAPEGGEGPGPGNWTERERDDNGKVRFEEKHNNAPCFAEYLCVMFSAAATEGGFAAAWYATFTATQSGFGGEVRKSGDT